MQMIKTSMLLIASLFVTCQASAGASFSDAQAIGYIVASDDGQIEMSRIVEAKSKNPAIKKFALHMIKVHEDRTAQLLAIAKKSGIRPADSNDNSKLEATLKEDVKDLKASTEATLDKMFVNQEIDHHRSVLQELNSVLVPSAEDAELKTVLRDMQARVPGNLATAEQLLSTLK